VADLVTDRIARSATAEAYRYPRADGGWESVTWGDAGRRIMSQAAGLIALGVGPGDRVAIMSGTRYEWILADLAAICAGAATTSVYPSTMAKDVAYIVADSQSRVVVAEDRGQAAKLVGAHGGRADGERADGERADGERADGPRWVVLIDGEPGEDERDRVLSLAELERRGDELLADQPAAVTDRIAGVRPENLASLIYTSGTTGRPKGVRLPHSAWVYEAGAIAALDLLHADDLQLLWLPLSHSFGKVLLVVQLAIGFPTAIDGRIDRIVDNMAAVQPTFMGSAPRIFEKAHARIVTTVESEGGVKARLFGWATGVGREVSNARLASHRVSPWLAARHRVADALVLSRIRKRFGGRVRFLISGSAALDQELARWFHAAGILVLEGYGLTETAAGACLNTPFALRFGTVGRPLPGTEAVLAADGELLLRSPGVMEGYHNLPQATADALEPDGWLHTGDIGEIDADGFVRIIDRKKDLFKTSGGKYVAPSPIESRFMMLCPMVAQIVVHGEGRKHCTALIALEPESLRGWAEQRGLSGTHGELVTHPAVVGLIAGYVDELNAGLNRWETVKKFTLLERELTVVEGELTPSLKVRRKIVEDAYRDLLDAMYE
jgi:long-chain acyl-CoA synthetase